MPHLFRNDLCPVHSCACRRGRDRLCITETEEKDRNGHRPAVSEAGCEESPRACRISRPGSCQGMKAADAPSLENFRQKRVNLIDSIHSRQFDSEKTPTFQPFDARLRGRTHRLCNSPGFGGRRCKERRKVRYTTPGFGTDYLQASQEKDRYI